CRGRCCGWCAGGGVNTGTPRKGWVREAVPDDVAGRLPGSAGRHRLAPAAQAGGAAGEGRADPGGAGEAALGAVGPGAGAQPPTGMTGPATPRLQPGPAADSWELLAGEVAACTRCALHRSRNCTVFGVGDRQARWLIVGEAPGAEEDRRGEPFVGRAGKLLDSMLRAIGLSRQQVYIANILKCRPPDNRTPLPAEVAQCLPYLERQIALLRPSIML